MDIKNFIKYILSELEAHSNLLLVVITGVYVMFTYRMMLLMKNQVVAKIKVTDIVIKSCFRREKIGSEENDFLNTIIKTPLNLIISSHNLYFKLCFNVRNSSSGSGSIDKPLLVLKYKNQYIKNWHDEEYVINPITIEWEYVRDINNGQYNQTEYKDKDLGKTIFLQGGDSKKIEVEYKTHPVSKKDLPAFSGLMALLKENPFRLEYFIRYKDNLGKNYEIKVENIESDRDY